MSRPLHTLPCPALPCPALPCPAPALFYPLRSTARSSSSSTLAPFSVIGPPKIKSSFVSLPLLLAPPPLPSPSSRHSLPTRIYEAARYQSPREVFKRRRERGAAATRELLERNTPREAANQTTRQESRPLKRVVFHTPPVTD